MTVLVTLVVIFTTLSPLTLNAEESRVMRFEIGNTTFTIDGVIQEHNVVEWQVLGADLPIYIDPIYDRTMAPTWMVTRAVNGFLDFCHRDQILFMMRDGTLLRFAQDDSRSDSVGVLRIHEDTGAWFLPLRYVAEAFGYEVIWDDAAQAVYIIER